MPRCQKLALMGTVCLQALALSLDGSLAQEAATATELATELERITITASKREQELGKADMSVTAVSGEELAAQGIATVEDLQKVFPGVSTGMRGNRVYSNVTVRGMSSPDYFNPTVQVYIDGVPQLPSVFAQPLGDVERVELLRGPQGTLYGANAYGGVINIITRRPDKNRYYIQGNISPNEPGTEAGGTIAVIPGSLFLDFAANYSYFAGDIDNATSGKDNVNIAGEGGGRATLRYAPEGGDFDGLISFAQQKLRSHEELYVFPGSVNSRTYESALYGSVPLLTRDVTTLSAQGNYHLGDVTLSSVSSYQKSDVTRDFGAGPGTRYSWPQEEEMFSQELRLAYEGERFSGVGGLWYSHNDFMGWKDAISPWYGDSTNNVVSDSFAAFGELTWHATSRLDITGGLRATHDRSEIDAFRADSYSTGMGFDFNRKASFSSVQPKLALGYQFTPDLRGFAVVSRGYKPGGFNHSISSTIDAASYNPESAWNFEAGVRSDLLDGRASLAASVYHIRSSDKQIYVGQIGQQFIRNVGEAESTGIELEGTWRATHRLTLTGNAAFGKSKFTDFTDPYTGTSYDGNRIPYAPDFTGHLNVAFLLSDSIFGGALTANGAVHGFSQSYFDEANVAGQGAFATFDASLSLAREDGFSGRLYVQNIADTSFRTSGYIGSGGTELATLGKGRTFGLTFRKEF